jgi:Na+/H+ antiporter NhaD/arsenite permease-like protein
LSYYAAVDKREIILVIAVAAFWIFNGVHDWRRAQRKREESHQPRTFRDDALMIVAAILVVVGTFVFMPRNATHFTFAVVFIGLVVVVYFLLHRPGERRPRSTDGSESSANPPSAER